MEVVGVEDGELADLAPGRRQAQAQRQQQSEDAPVRRHVNEDDLIMNPAEPSDGKKGASARPDTQLALCWATTCGRDQGMFCPECRVEYREGFTECSDCLAALVRDLRPEPEPDPEVQYATVVETGNPAVLAVAKSVLGSAGIDHLAAGEEAVTGPVSIRVRRRTRPRLESCC